MSNLLYTHNEHSHNKLIVVSDACSKRVRVRYVI